MLVFIPTAHQDSVPEERSSCVRGEYCPELISLCLQEQEGKKHPVFPPEALGCPRASGVVSAEFAQHREVQNPARPLWPGSSAELKKAGLQPKWVMHFQSWKIPSFFFFLLLLYFWAICLLSSSLESASEHFFPFLGKAARGPAATEMGLGATGQEGIACPPAARSQGTGSGQQHRSSLATSQWHRGFGTNFGHQMAQEEEAALAVGLNIAPL